MATSQANFIDPATLRQKLLVPTDGGARLLSEVIDPWQEQDFAAVDPALRRIMGQPTPNAKMRVLLKRGRGHSKTSDVGLMALSAIAGSPNRIEGICAAGDSDQAQLIVEAINRLVYYNRVLKDLVKVDRFRVTNKGTGSFLDVTSSDVSTSWGRTVQLIAIDEFSHWRDSGEALWHSLFSTAGKTECLLIIGTNAFLGAGSSWQWRVAAAARRSPAWHVSELPGPIASWITPDRLDEQRELLPDKVFRRVWLNEDIAEAGDLLNNEDIVAAVKENMLPLAGRNYDPNVQKASWLSYVFHTPKFDTTPKGLVFVAGLDLARKRNFSSLVVLGCDLATNRARLAECRFWRPPRGGEIDFTEVEEAVADAHQRFGLSSCRYDPNDATLLSQRLRERGVPMVETPFTAANHNIMASRLIDVFKERRIDLFPHEQLTRDLRSLLFVENPSTKTLKIGAATASDGSHADCAIALALANMDAVDRIASGSAPQIVFEGNFILGRNELAANPFRNRSFRPW